MILSRLAPALFLLAVTASCHKSDNDDAAPAHQAIRSGDTLDAAVAERMAKNDVDGDGKLSDADVATGSVGTMATLDTQNTGKLSTMTADTIPGTKQLLDTDSDGNVTAAEVSAHHVAMSRRLLNGPAGASMPLNIENTRMVAIERALQDQQGAITSIFYKADVNPHDGLLAGDELNGLGAAVGAITGEVLSDSALLAAVAGDGATEMGFVELRYYAARTVAK